MSTYSGKLLRETNFTNFEVLWLFAKVWIVISTDLQNFLLYSIKIYIQFSASEETQHKQFEFRVRFLSSPKTPGGVLVVGVLHLRFRDSWSKADGDTGQLDAWTSGFCTSSAFSSVGVEANNMHICSGTVDQWDWIYCSCNMVARDLYLSKQTLS